MSPRLRAVVEFYEALSPSSVGRVAELYAADAHFVDPFNDVRGHAAIEQIFRHMYAHLDEPRFSVLECYEQEGRAVLLWDFAFRLKGRQSEYRLQGMSRIAFDSAGRVSTHRDYWDAAGELYARMPLLGALMRYLRRRLSATG